MKTSASLFLLVLATAAACGTATESPVAPPSLAYEAEDSEPPPPPLDTQSVELDGGAGAVSLNYFSTRYFINKNENVAWITFQSGVDTAEAGATDDTTYTASPEARLLFTRLNTTTPSVSGTGIISGPRGSVDLSKITLDPATTLNSCSSSSVVDEVTYTSVRGDYRTVNCGGVSFSGREVTGGFTVYKLVPLTK